MKKKKLAGAAGLNRLIDFMFCRRLSILVNAVFVLPMDYHASSEVALLTLKEVSTVSKIISLNNPLH